MDFHITELVSEKNRRKVSFANLKLTQSWRATILLSSFIFGIALASFVDVYVALVLVFCAALLFALIRSRGNTNSVFVIVVLLSITFGIFRYQFALPAKGPNSISAFVGETVQLKGVVVDEIEKSNKTQRLVLGELEIDNKSISQKLLATVPFYPEFVFGDKVEFTCEIKKPEPFDGFRYDRYLARKGILATCQSYKELFHLGRSHVGVRGALLDFKSSVLNQVRAVFHEPYAALLEGLLLGEKNLPDNIEDEFRRVGLSYIIAASGQNVSLVAGVLMSLLTAVFLKRKQASAVVLVGILTYVFLAGAGAAVVRAGIMGSVVVLSALVGRIVSSRNLLLAAMAAMLMHNPLLLRDDVGFQLSFAATAGLVVLQPKLSGFFSFVPKFAGIRESLSMSIAAIAATLPVIFVSFGQVSLVAPFANLFVLPLVPFVMIAGACVIIVSSMFYEVALCISAPVVGGLKIIFGISHILSSLSFASVDIAHVSWLRALVFILSIILLRSILTLKPIKNSESNGGLSFKYFVMVSAILCLPIIPDLFPSRIFTSTFFSVGQGDSTFFELPSGQRLLIDGGPDETVLVKLGQTLPWYSRRIDSFFLTHADADHITGAVSVSKRYEIKNVYLSADSHTSNMEILRDVWSIRGVPVSFVNAGYVVDFQDTKLNVLAPRTGLASSDNNKSSMILEVMYKDKKILLMGDADKETELEILTRLSHADVLKVGHHGSYTSTSQEFLKSISADLAVISVGENNIYGHPHGIVLDRLKKSGVEILRTDLFGDIRIQISENGELTTLAGSPTY